MPSKCVDMHSPLSKIQFFNHNAFAKDCKCDTDLIPDLLSTLSKVWIYRWHWFWRQQQHFGRLWGCRRKLIEWNGRDPLIYVFKDIFICTIKEQCSDNANIHEGDRTTDKTQYMIMNAKVNGCIIWIRLLHNECERSIYDFSSFKLGYQNEN